MVQMDEESVIAKHLESFVVMSVHVAHEEIQNGHVYNV